MARLIEMGDPNNPSDGWWALSIDAAGNNITFNTAGARRFGRATQENVGKPFAIILDDKVLSAPNINEPILGGNAQISGSFTVQSAHDLAISLASGRPRSRRRSASLRRPG